MLKQLFSTALFISISFICANAQSSVRVNSNDAFGYGEKITYKVKYNLYFNFTVGEVNFQVADKPELIGGNDCYHVTGTGTTYGFYDPFYRVRILKKKVFCLYSLSGMSTKGSIRLGNMLFSINPNRWL